MPPDIIVSKQSSQTHSYARIHLPGWAFHQIIIDFVRQSRNGDDLEPLTAYVPTNVHKFRVAVVNGLNIEEIFKADIKQ